MCPNIMWMIKIPHAQSNVLSRFDVISILMMLIWETKLSVFLFYVQFLCLFYWPCLIKLVWSLYRNFLNLYENRVNMKFSIVTTTYNSVATVRNTVESVAAQVFDGDIEYIVA